jgi:hypothetical protein
MSALQERAGDIPTRAEIRATLDPDAENQRWYSCMGCGHPCINPIGTIPERWDRCLDCAHERLATWDF